MLGLGALRHHYTDVHATDIAGAVAQGAGLPALVPDQSKVAVAVAVPKAKKKKGGAVLKTSVKTLDTTKWSAANQEPEQPTAQGRIEPTSHCS